MIRAARHAAIVLAAVTSVGLAGCSSSDETTPSERTDGGGHADVGVDASAVDGGSDLAGDGGLDGSVDGVVDTTETGTGGDASDTSSGDSGLSGDRPDAKACDEQTARPVTPHTSESGGWKYLLADEYDARVSQTPEGRSDGAAVFLFGGAERSIAGAVVSRSYDAGDDGAVDPLYETVRPAVEAVVSEVSGSVLPSMPADPDTRTAKASFAVQTDESQSISEFRNALIDDFSPIAEEEEAGPAPTAVEQEGTEFNIRVRTVLRWGEGASGEGDDLLAYLVAVSDQPGGTLDERTLEMDALRSPTNLTGAQAEHREECVIESYTPSLAPDKVRFAHRPAVQSIAVYVDQEPIAHSLENGWTYFPVDPWVRFNGEASLEERDGAEVEVTLAYRRVE